MWFLVALCVGSVWDLCLLCVCVCALCVAYDCVVDLAMGHAGAHGFSCSFVSWN